MPARPLNTFQSEGWYAPSRAREHYFRPTPAHPTILRSLCGGWEIGEGLRPHMTPFHRRDRKPCQKCDTTFGAALAAPGAWFTPEETTP